MKSFIIPGVLLLFISAFNLTAQWVQMSNGMGTGPVSSLASNRSYIFAGLASNYQGIYYSTNNGTNWIQTLSYLNCYSLAVNGNNVFAGTVRFPHPPYTQVLYLSTNNGINWSESLIYRTVYSLAINGNNIYAGTESYGVYLSTSNGATWTQTSLNNQYVYSLAVNGNNIFAGSSYYVYLSTNNGTNWIQASLNNLTVHSLAVNGNNIFAGTDASIYLSTNNGTNWTQAGLNNLTVFSLAVNGNNIFAGTNYGVYVSNNNGTIWTQRNEGLGNQNVKALSILNNYIFAGTGNSVYRRSISELTGIKPISNEIPYQYQLYQNYPNPFNPKTIIRFKIKDTRFTTLKVYDILGREAATLVNEFLKPGTYEADFDRSNFSSGIYYYKLVAGDYTATRKMVLKK